MNSECFRKEPDATPPPAFLQPADSGISSIQYHKEYEIT